MPHQTHPDAATLQDQLDEITANTRALVPAERLATLEQVVADLTHSGIEDRLLPLGAQAPDFTLRTPQNKQVSLHDLLALGPVVLKFFRGRWDAYDMTELERWQALLPTLRERRGLLVAISPQTLRQNAFTADRHHLTFPLLADPACALATQFGAAHVVPEAARRYFRSILVNLPFLNGEDSWRIPLPLSAVVAPDGRIRFMQGFADHRRRPEPADVLAALP